MNALSNLSSTSARGAIPRWPWLLVLVWVAGLAGVPAHAQDANPIATGVAPVAKDFAGFSPTKLDMPFLVLTGEKASGTFLIDQASWWRTT